MVPLRSILSAARGGFPYASRGRRVGLLGRLLLLLLVALLARAGDTICLGSEAEPFRAGVARVNPTPPPEFKAALGGYGARLSKPAVGVHDSVWAKAIVLERGGKRFAFVTADVLAFPPGFKAAVLKRLDRATWTPEQVLLLPSHSHTSIDMMALHPGNVFNNRQVGLFHRELFEATAGLLAKVILEAAASPAPVLVGSITTEVPDRNRNRRRDGEVHDSDLTVTRIDLATGHPLAVLVNWTAHPTFMDEEDMLFSGDWPGHLQRTVEALVGRQVTAFYYNGAEGDQSPTPPPGCGSNWERAEVYGRSLGILAWEAWGKIQPKPVEAFGFELSTFSLPTRQWHPDFMKTGGAEYGLTEETMRSFVEQLVPAESACASLRLGDLLVLGVPAEMAAELGMEVKRKGREVTGAKCVAIGGLANEWISYALPAREYRKGGYEASMCFYGETLGATLVEAALRTAVGAK